VVAVGDFMEAVGMEVASGVVVVEAGPEEGDFQAEAEASAAEAAVALGSVLLFLLNILSLGISG
jgi:hypothetical protein